MRNLPIVCHRGLMEQVDGEVELLGELCGIFRDYYPEVIERIRIAVETLDHPGIFEAAHQLKGSLTSFHATRAIQTVEFIEALGRDNKSSLVDAQVLCETLEMEIFELLGELDRVATL